MFKDASLSTFSYFSGGLSRFSVETLYMNTVRLVMTETALYLFSDWVDVANDLFSKCHINLRLRRLTDCDANVFVTLYESILGEKVPGKNKL